MRWAKDRFFQRYFPFIRHDKLEHLLGSALLFAFLWFELTRIVTAYDGAFLMGMVVGLGRNTVCFAVGLAAGLLWELKDGLYQDGFSWKDLAADALGLWLMSRVVF